MTPYGEFLARRAQIHNGAGFEPLWMPDWLYGFQSDVTGWALQQGRSALFLDCGMGKTPAALVWAENVRRHTGKPVLILTFLAVAAQFEREAAKFGIDAAVSRDGTLPAGIVIANYERLDRFRPDQFGGVVCDESSAIKAFGGATRAAVTEFLRTVPYRLLDTATPNDYVELGTSSEALGYLGHTDMLGMFFTNRERTNVGRSGARGRWRATGADPWRFANPPFNLAGQPEAWADHLLAIATDPHLLAPGAVVAAIVPAIVLTGKSRRVKAVHALIEDCGGAERHPAGVFAAAVQTAAIWFQTRCP